MLKKLRDRISFLQAKYLDVAIALCKAFWAIWGSIMIAAMVMIYLLAAMLAVLLCAAGVLVVLDAMLA